MSTRGCFGFRIGRDQHMLPSWHDSYPEGLGEYIVSQVRDADLDTWARLAQRLRPTEHEDRLTDGELQHIKQWLTLRLEVGLSYDPDETEAITINVGPDMVFSDIDLRRLVELIGPGLSARPHYFWGMLWGDCRATLSLGLYPRLRGSFISSPFCEWVYVVNFNTKEFVVGKGCYEFVEFLARPSDQEVDGCINSIASFPLDAIPHDWKSIVEERVQSAA